MRCVLQLQEELEPPAYVSVEDLKEELKEQEQEVRITGALF